MVSLMCFLLHNVTFCCCPRRGSFSILPPQGKRLTNSSCIVSSMAKLSKSGGLMHLLLKMVGGDVGPLEGLSVGLSEELPTSNKGAELFVVELLPTENIVELVMFLFIAAAFKAATASAAVVGFNSSSAKQSSYPSSKIRCSSSVKNVQAQTNGNSSVSLLPNSTLNCSAIFVAMMSLLVSISPGGGVCRRVMDMVSLLADREIECR